MKIKITITRVFDFDIEEERKRITAVFSGDQQKRQLEILDAFLQLDFDTLKQKLSELPYDTKRECHEKEYVGGWIDILQDNGWHSSPISSVTEVDLIEDDEWNKNNNQ
jgi:hypothetical protein